MKYLSLLLLVISLTLNSCSILSGIDEDGKKMMDFVKKIVEKPNRIEEIIKSSEFYSSELTEMIRPDYKIIIINSINAYKRKGIQYLYEKDLVRLTLDGNRYKYNTITISSDNPLYSPHISFYFKKINDRWILIDILWGY